MGYHNNNKNVKHSGVHDEQTENKAVQSYTAIQSSSAILHDTLLKKNRTFTDMTSPCQPAIDKHWSFPVDTTIEERAQAHVASPHLPSQSSEAHQNHTSLMVSRFSTSGG